jgi:hypothetical protein
MAVKRGRPLYSKTGVKIKNIMVNSGSILLYSESNRVNSEYVMVNVKNITLNLKNIVLNLENTMVNLENTMVNLKNTMVNSENTMVKNTRCRNASYFNYLTIVSDHGIFDFYHGVFHFHHGVFDFHRGVFDFCYGVCHFRPAVCAEDHGLREKDPALRGKTHPDGDKYDALPIKDQAPSNKAYGLCEKRRPHSSEDRGLDTGHHGHGGKKAAVGGIHHDLYGFSHSLFDFWTQFRHSRRLFLELQPARVIANTCVFRSSWPPIPESSWPP